MNTPFSKQIEKSRSKESGFVLVFSLVLLVVISLMAVFATSISNIEVQTSTNNEKFQTAFLLGEGVTIESVGLLNLEEYDDLISFDPQIGTYDDWLDRNREEWEKNGYSGPAGPDLTDAGNWAGAQVADTALNDPMDEGGLLPPGFDAATDNLQFAVQDAHLADGFTPTPSQQVRSYYLYGRYDVGRSAAFPGRNIFEMGFRKLLQVPESL